MFKKIIIPDSLLLETLRMFDETGKHLKLKWSHFPEWFGKQSDFIFFQPLYTFLFFPNICKFKIWLDHWGWEVGRGCRQAWSLHSSKTEAVLQIIHEFKSVILFDYPEHCLSSMLFNMGTIPSPMLYKPEEANTETEIILKWSLMKSKTN